jgi:oligopeptide/dipeptide ABC transporter ATP-binding protein
MYLGRIVESGPVEQVFNEPLHPYTQVLREASPVPDPRARSIAVRIEGEVPSAANPPTGCHFHPRCPHAMPICKTEYPKWTQASAARGVACHLHNQPAG